MRARNSNKHVFTLDVALWTANDSLAAFFQLHSTTNVILISILSLLSKVWVSKHMLILFTKSTSLQTFEISKFHLCMIKQIKK